MLGRWLGRNSQKAKPGNRAVLQAEQAHTTAVERGSELGINEWQLRREQLQLGAKYASLPGLGTSSKHPTAVAAY